MWQVDRVRAAVLQQLSYVVITRCCLVCRNFSETSRWLTSRAWSITPKDMADRSHVVTLQRMVRTAAAGQRIELCPGCYQLTGDSNSLDDVRELFEQPIPPDEDTAGWEEWRVAINQWIPQWRAGKGGLLVQTAGVALVGLAPGVELLYTGGHEGDCVIEVRGEDVSITDINVKVCGSLVGSVCVHSGSVTLERCEFVSGQLYVEEGSYCAMDGCRILNSQEHGVSVQGRASLRHTEINAAAMDGIHVYSPGTVELFDCSVLRSAEDGVAAEGEVLVMDSLRACDCLGCGLAAVGDLGRIEVKQPSLVQLEGNAMGEWDSFGGGQVLFSM